MVEKREDVGSCGLEEAGDVVGTVVVVAAVRFRRLSHRRPGVRFSSVGF